MVPDWGVPLEGLVPVSSSDASPSPSSASSIASSTIESISITVPCRPSVFIFPHLSDSRRTLSVACVGFGPREAESVDLPAFDDVGFDRLSVDSYGLAPGEFPELRQIGR